jgi:hypothetical protein
MKLILSWLLVALPLGWGVMKTVEQSRKLFASEVRAAKDPPK